MEFTRTKVFISYSHSAARPVRALLQFLPPQLFDVYCDVDRLHPGWQWEPVLNSIIRNADVLVMIVGKDFEQRPFLVREFELYSDAHRDAARVIPILIEERDDIPNLLSRFQVLDLRGADAPSRDRDRR